MNNIEPIEYKAEIIKYAMQCPPDLYCLREVSILTVFGYNNEPVWIVLYKTHFHYDTHTNRILFVSDLDRLAGFHKLGNVCRIKYFTQEQVKRNTPLSWNELLSQTGVTTQ